MTEDSEFRRARRGRSIRFSGLGRLGLSGLAKIFNSSFGLPLRSRCSSSLDRVGR